MPYNSVTKNQLILYMCSKTSCSLHCYIPIWMKFIPLCSGILVVIYFLLSYTTNLLNPTLHAACFGHPQHPQALKYIIKTQVDMCWNYFVIFLMSKSSSLKRLSLAKLTMWLSLPTYLWTTEWADDRRETDTCIQEEEANTCSYT